MPKYYRSRGYRRRYRKRSTPARRYARTQAKTALQYSKQKFTTVYDIRYAANEETYGNTISLIGGKGVTPSIAGGITTLSNVNNDQVLTSQMTLHQQFKITGVAVKLMFAPPTETWYTNYQWSLSYSRNDIISPICPADRLQTLQSYQTGPCVQTTPITRYFPTATALRTFGIDWCETIEFINGSFDQPQTPLYSNQLAAGTGSSLSLRVQRLNTGADAQAGGVAAVTGKVQVTYYVTFRGTKGINSIVT